MGVVEEIRRRLGKALGKQREDMKLAEDEKHFLKHSLSTIGDLAKNVNVMRITVKSQEEILRKRKLKA